MAPYVSVVMQSFIGSSMVRLLVPLDGLALYERPGASWLWMPDQMDAVDLSRQATDTFLGLLGLRGATPAVREEAGSQVLDWVSVTRTT